MSWSCIAGTRDGFVRVFRRLYEERFPIRRMRLVDRYGADDDRSMAADNTSAFNCRLRAGSSTEWSQHAYGRAIDVNPVENPFVTPTHVSPPAGVAYVDRTQHLPGMIHVHDARVVGVPRDRLGVGRPVARARSTTSTSVRTVDDALR